MNNIETDDNQPVDATFLIGSTIGHEILDKTCPSARTLVAHSATLKSWVVIQIRCKRWGCRHCGERKITHFAWRCDDAKPNRLITLTVANKMWETPRLAYDGVKGKVTQLAIRLRRTFGEFEYFKVLEVTKKGWPHFHLVVRSEYIPHATISDIWSQLTGAHIVDVRKLKKSRDVYFYVCKYLAKQKYIPWTNRRVSWSRNFFPPNEFKGGDALQLTEIGWNEEHPSEVMRKFGNRAYFTTYSNDCWLIQKEYGCQTGLSMEQLKMKRLSRKLTKKLRNGSEGQG